MAVTKNQKSELFKNQRKSVRVNCLVPVDGKTGGAFDQTATIDFSKGGLGIISRKAVPINKKIVIELNLSPEDPETFLVVGRVKWVHRSAPDSYRVGLAFEEVLQGSKSRLAQYFARLD